MSRSWLGQPFGSGQEDEEGLATSQCQSVIVEFQYQKRQGFIGLQAKWKPKRQRQGRWKRKGSKGAQKVGPEGEVEGGVIIHSRFTTPKLHLAPENSVSCWVSDSAFKFHHLKPDTYPAQFFVSSSAIQQCFVISQMTLLFVESKDRHECTRRCTPPVTRVPTSGVPRSPV